MKIFLLALLLSMSFIHASDTASTQAISKSVASFTPIVLSDEVSSTFKNMILDGFEQLKKDEKEHDLVSSVGKLYVLVASKGINSLGQDPQVVAQMNKYIKKSRENTYVAQLFSIAQELAQQKKPELERLFAWSAAGTALCLSLSKQMKQDIPNLKIMPTVQGTIEENTELKLDAEQTNCYQAGQLAMAMNLQLEWDEDEESYKVQFKKWLPKDQESWASQLGRILRIS